MLGMYFGAITPVNIIEWLLFVGISGCIIMGADKALAVRGNERIRERALWITAFAGGFWGIIFGAFIFHHKTRKLGFWPPVILATLLWLSIPVMIRAGVIRL